MARFDHPAMDLEPEYYAAIGEFIFRYAQLEYQLHEIIWFSLGLSYERGRILTIGTDSKVLRAMLLAITKTKQFVKEPRHTQEINSLCSTSKKLYPLRNYLVHGTWQSQDATAKDARIHYMKEVDDRILPRRSELTHAEIYKGASSLKSANALAQRLIIQLGGVPLPSQRKYERRIYRSRNS